MTRLKLLMMITLLMATVVTVACSVGSSEPDSPPLEEDSPSTEEESGHGEGDPKRQLWAYDGENGPDNWANLDPEYGLCSKGEEQSPINIVNTSLEDLNDISFEYKEVPLVITNNGHTVQVNYPPGSFIDIDGATYQLLQFHFHSPSEHALEGELANAEMHLVHQNSDGELAVVGVLLYEGETNEAFNAVWAHLPTELTPPTSHPETLIQAVDLLPETRTYYNYDGSLTTPPCSEGVNWFVLTEGVEISSAQLDALYDIIDDSNRPVQSLGEREVIEDGS